MNILMWGPLLKQFCGMYFAPFMKLFLRLLHFRMATIIPQCFISENCRVLHTRIRLLFLIITKIARQTKYTNKQTNPRKKIKTKILPSLLIIKPKKKSRDLFLFNLKMTCEQLTLSSIITFCSWFLSLRFISMVVLWR